jgi:hypothetical protein
MSSGKNAALRLSLHLLNSSEAHCPAREYVVVIAGLASEKPLHGHGLARGKSRGEHRNSTVARCTLALLHCLVHGGRRAYIFRQL